MGLILNPEVFLRKYPKRIMVYAVDSKLKIVRASTFVAPITAILLTMFDGKRSFEEIAKDICFLTDMTYNKDSKQEILDRIKKLEENLEIRDSLLVDIETIPVQEQKPRYNPMDFAIPAEEVKLDRHDRRLDFPISINYNVTSQCPFDCKYCYHPRFPVDEFISLERLDTLFNECVENGCNYITLSGGDPFARPDIYEIMEMLHQKGLEFSASTKTYLDKEKCKRLKERCGVDYIQYSLDSTDSEIAAFLTGMDQGYLTRAKETVTNLLEAGIEVKLKAVLTNYNIDGLADYLNMCVDFGIKDIQTILYGRSLWVHNDNLFPTIEQMDRANKVVEEFRQKYPDINLEGGNYAPAILTNNPTDREEKELFEERGVCNAGRLALTMLPNGEISICEQLQYSPEIILGDLRTQSIKEMWNSKRVMDFLTPPPRSYFPDGVPCKTCEEEMYNICHRWYSRCLRDTYHYYQTYHAPDIRCPLAKVQDFRTS